MNRGMRMQTLRVKTVNLAQNTFDAATNATGIMMDHVPSSNVTMFGVYAALFSQYKITQVKYTFLCDTLQSTDDDVISRLYIRPHSNTHVIAAELTPAYFAGAPDWHNVAFTNDYRRFQITVRPYYVTANAQGNYVKQRDWLFLSNDIGAATLWHGLEVFNVGMETGQTIVCDTEVTCLFRGNMQQV